MTIEPDRLVDQAAEAAVLGSMMQDSKQIPAVLECLTKGSFAIPEHVGIFDAITKVYSRNLGGAVDGVLVRSELAASGVLKGIGGLGYLRQVVESVPTSENARYYADRVSKRERFRQLVTTIEAMEKIVMDGGDVDDQVEQVQGLAMGLAVEHGRDVVKASAASEIALETQQLQNVVLTGFKAVDDITGGFHEGDLGVVAGRTSQGKTACAGGVSLNATEDDKRVLILSLEMTPKQILERLIATEAGVNLQEIKSGKASKDALDRFYEASLEIEKRPLTIIGGTSTPESVAGAIQQLKQAEGVDLVVLDYLQLMTVSGRRGSNRNDEVATISRSLKQTALRYEVPLLVLSQLNRQVESRDGHRPRMSDLRDSGAIEQDADAIMLLYREDYYRKQANPDTTDLDGIAEVIICKNRNGRVGTARLVFIEESMKFTNLIGGVLA